MESLSSNKVTPGTLTQKSKLDSAEMNWLDFEVRMRDVIRELVQPVIQVGEQDRESVILLDRDQHNLRIRVKRIEQAVLNLDETGEKSYFDKADDKMLELKIYVEQNV